MSSNSNGLTSATAIEPLNGQASEMDKHSIRGLLAMTKLTDPDMEYSELRRDREGGHSISNGT